MANDTASPLTENPSDELPRKRVKRNYVAGGLPCGSCSHAKKAQQCRYPSRDRKVTVMERYLRTLVTENAAFKQAQSAGSSLDRTVRNAPEATDGTLQADDEMQSQPTVTIVSKGSSSEHERQISFEASTVCTSFGDELLSCFAHEEIRPDGTPAREYARDDCFNRLCGREYQLPNRVQANLLVRVASRYILYRDASIGERSNDPVWICKFFVVLALGELYTNQSQDRNKETKNSIPRTNYFLTAIGLLQDLYEEPSVQQIENLLLFSFYSNALGRTNSAYVYGGIALRLSLIPGLHRRKQIDQIHDEVELENSRRVWWTVYTFDRIYSSRLGRPVTIHDTDIDVPMPSSNHLDPINRNKFEAPDHLCANIRLTRITGQILNDLYGAASHDNGFFLSKLRGILTDLRSWDKELPESLRLRLGGPRSLSSLHLHFNLCIIQTTRPVLMHMFKRRNPFRQHAVPNNAIPNAKSPASLLDVTNQAESAQAFPPTTLALGEACVQAARASNNILTQCFIDNSLAVFGYFDAHYLFSSTLILIMSAVMEPNPTDSDAVQTALNLLNTMQNCGNVSAKAYYIRLDCIKTRIAKLKGDISKKDGATATRSLTGPCMSAGEVHQNVNSLSQEPPATLLSHNIFSAHNSSEELWLSNPFPYDEATDKHLALDFAADPLDNPFIRNFLSEIDGGDDFDGMTSTLGNDFSVGETWGVDLDHDSIHF
ncbi:hypothetical protein D6D08_02546 [Aureobasidium pullulans]|nr:hypothetical protein D6D08_02546 [Aureobasidium pullulans]